MKLVIIMMMLLLTAPVQAQVVFSDSNFQDADWTSTVLTLNTPGAGGQSAHAMTGGNPGEHRTLESFTCPNIPCKAMMIEIKNSASYDPATQGEISSLDYGEDQLCSSADGCVGGGQNWLPVCVQNGIFYIYNSQVPTGVVETWTTKSVSGLTAADFAEVDLSATGMSHPGLNPDFSATGALLQFGYARANSLNSARTGRIDNWWVSIIQLPVAAEGRSWGSIKSVYR